MSATRNGISWHYAVCMSYWTVRGGVALMLGGSGGNFQQEKLRLTIGVANCQQLSMSAPPKSSSGSWQLPTIGHPTPPNETTAPWANHGMASMSPVSCLQGREARRQVGVLDLGRRIQPGQFRASRIGTNPFETRQRQDITLLGRSIAAHRSRNCLFICGHSSIAENSLGSLAPIALLSLWQT